MTISLNIKYVSLLDNTVFMQHSTREIGCFPIIVSLGIYTKYDCFESCLYIDDVINNKIGNILKHT